MAALILLVNADRVALGRMEALLSDAGYLVLPVSSFSEAKRLLYSVNPDLLIADVRLDAFNGLHLAVRSRHDFPELPVIITHLWADQVLENEASRQGATFVVNPLDNPDFPGAVQSAIERRLRAQRPIRRWPRKQISGVVEAELAASRARILDMSYGGMKLVVGNENEFPSLFDVTVPIAGVTVQARPVWTYRSEATAEYWCGAEVVDTGSAAITEWRHFVDRAQ